MAEPRSSVIPNYSSAEIFIQVLHWLVTYSRGTHHHSPQCKGCPCVVQHSTWIILDSGSTSIHPTFPSLSTLVQQSGFVSQFSFQLQKSNISLTSLSKREITVCLITHSWISRTPTHTRRRGGEDDSDGNRIHNGRPS